MNPNLNLRHCVRAKLSMLLTLILFSFNNHAQLLNEVVVNPNGPDANCEYVEIKGTPGTALTNYYFVSVEGDNTSNPGVADFVVSLTGQSIGSSSFFVITPSDTGSPCDRSYNTPLTNRLFSADMNGGILEAGANSWLLIQSSSAIVEGVDYDTDNNGTLESLPGSAVIVDGIGWQANGDVSDIVYGSLLDAIAGITPDAAVRFPSNDSANDSSAWYYGDMQGLVDSLSFDVTQASANFPDDGELTPGQNNIADGLIFKNGFQFEAFLVFDDSGELVEIQFTDPDFEITFVPQSLYVGLQEGKPRYLQVRLTKFDIEYRILSGNASANKAADVSPWLPIDSDILTWSQ